ncbi:hypothetical protein CEXT_340911, partial [Caerostris extrusa]
LPLALEELTNVRASSLSSNFLCVTIFGFQYANLVDQIPESVLRLIFCVRLIFRRR